MKKLSYIIVDLIFILSSCKKPIILLPDITPGVKINSLSGTAWKTIGSTTLVDYGGGLIVNFDLIPSLPQCNLDNISWFLTNGTTATDEGLTKCDPATPQYAVNGSWILSTDKKILTIKTTVPNAVNLTQLDCEVLQMDSNILKIRYTTYYNGPKSVTTTTYARAN